MKKPSTALYSTRDGKKVDEWLHEEIIANGTGDAEAVGIKQGRRIGLSEEELNMLRRKS